MLGSGVLRGQAYSWQERPFLEAFAAPVLTPTSSRVCCRQAFPTYWVPYVSCPYWLASLYSRLSGMLSQGWLHDTWGEPHGTCIWKSCPRAAAANS